MLLVLRRQLSDEGRLRLYELFKLVVAELRLTWSRYTRRFASRSGRGAIRFSWSSGRGGLRDEAQSAHCCTCTCTHATLTPPDPFLATGGLRSFGGSGLVKVASFGVRGLRGFGFELTLRGGGGGGGARGLRVGSWRQCEQTKLKSSAA